jgi:glycerol-3-phosphate dehydrogenase (NAD(P)+)
MSKVSIIGAGGMGCALAGHLSELGNDITVYTPFSDEAYEINKYHENTQKLPGVRIDPQITVTSHKVTAFKDADIVVIATPSKVLRNSLVSLLNDLPRKAAYVCCSKGIEHGSHLLLADVACEVLGIQDMVVLSGPSHAEEIAKKLPTAMVAASDNKDKAKYIQDNFSSEYLRIYTSDDIRGVELGGALKNVIALCAGIVDGMGYGDNTKAALMTRGMAEISRLGESMGARRETFFGLAGIGDLIVTCTSMHSRNRRAGIRIGKGMTVKEAVEGINMTVEGYETCTPAYELSLKHNVSMPITKALYDIINGNLDVEQAVKELMTRSKKDEFI